MLYQIFFSNWCRGFLFFFIVRIYIADLMSRISNLMIVDVFYSFHHKNLCCRFDAEDFYFKFDAEECWVFLLWESILQIWYWGFLLQIWCRWFFSEFWWDKCDVVFNLSFKTDVEVSNYNLKFFLNISRFFSFFQRLLQDVRLKALSLVIEIFIGPWGLWDAFIYFCAHIAEAQAQMHVYLHALLDFQFIFHLVL